MAESAVSRPAGLVGCSRAIAVDGATLFAKTLGDLSRSFRGQHSWTQEELAANHEPLHSADTISNLERGKARPHRHTVEAVSMAPGLDDTTRQIVWAHGGTRAAWYGEPGAAINRSQRRIRDSVSDSG
jgi:hypothetical protein